MKYLDEFRDARKAKRLSAAICACVTRPWTIMEVCGGQTHSILRYGIDRIVPKEVTLLHGPGCPVCVTPVEAVNRAIGIAALPGVLFCSFGDMLRVPGSSRDLLSAKAAGPRCR